MEVLSKSTKETEELAQRLAGEVSAGDVLALYGDLGSGKTTFTSYFVHALGIEQRVQSPTFVILRRYEGDGVGSIGTINHLDLYRLQSREELEDLGLQELFSEEGAITIIEWPELAEDLLPDNAIKIYFEYIDEDERKIDVQNLN